MSGFDLSPFEDLMRQRPALGAFFLSRLEDPPLWPILRVPAIVIAGVGVVGAAIGGIESGATPWGFLAMIGAGVFAFGVSLWGERRAAHRQSMFSPALWQPVTTRLLRGDPAILDELESAANDAMAVKMLATLVQDDRKRWQALAPTIRELDLASQESMEHLVMAALAETRLLDSQAQVVADHPLRIALRDAAAEAKRFGAQEYAEDPVEDLRERLEASRKELQLRNDATEEVRQFPLLGS